MTTRLHNAAVNKRRLIFAGREAGHYTLPDDVVAAHATVVALDELKVEVPDVPAAREALVVAVAEAAATGQHKLPDGKGLVRVLDARRAAEAVAVALNDAQERADSLLDGLLADYAESIIVDHLRAAHDQAVAAGKAGVAALAAAGLDPLTVAKADEALARALSEGALRDARRALIDSRARYAAVAEARGRLVEHWLGQPQLDTEPLFQWCRNMDEVHPPGWQRQQGPKPWPEGDPLAWWVWALTGRAELWLPTPAEQDARFGQVYGEAMQVMANARRASSGGIYVPA